MDGPEHSDLEDGLFILTYYERFNWPFGKFWMVSTSNTELHTDWINWEPQNSFFKESNMFDKSFIEVVNFFLLTIILH